MIRGARAKRVATPEPELHSGADLSVRAAAATLDAVLGFSKLPSTRGPEPLPVAFPELDRAIERLAPDERPAPVTISRARAWLSAVRATLRRASQRTWVAPHIAISPDGEVVFEWWNGRKTLTVYVDGTGAEFVRSWGRSVTKDMDDGTIGTADEIERVWRWLQSET